MPMSPALSGGLDAGSSGAFVPLKLGSVAVDALAAGSTTQILDAPPVGRIRWFFIAVRNTHASASLEHQMFDSAGLLSVATQAAGVTASFGAGNMGILHATTGPMSISIISAGGAAAAVTGFYEDQVEPDGFVTAALALTDTYQAIPALTPPAGKIAVPVGFVQGIGDTGFVLSPNIILNGDTASIQPNYKVTRSAVDYLLVPTAHATKTRTGIVIAVPPILNGDVFAVKLTTAPVVAGSVVTRFYCQTWDL